MALLSSFKASKFNHIFLHSLVSENDKNVPLIVFHFHMKLSKRNTLKFFFQKRRFQGFMSEILTMGEKFTFYNSLGTTKLSGV